MSQADLSEDLWHTSHHPHRRGKRAEVGRGASNLILHYAMIERGGTDGRLASGAQE
ncbi:hypothetical protein GCM10023080_026610 [Streptomyces pseudoechinosporeus]